MEFDFRYGPEAGKLAENTVYSATNIGLTAHTMSHLGPKAVAKRVAKDAGKAVVNDYNAEANPSPTEEESGEKAGEKSGGKVGEISKCNYAQTVSAVPMYAKGVPIFNAHGNTCATAVTKKDPSAVYSQGFDTSESGKAQKATAMPKCTQEDPVRHAFGNTPAPAYDTTDGTNEYPIMSNGLAGPTAKSTKQHASVSSKHGGATNVSANTSGGATRIRRAKNRDASAHAQGGATDALDKRYVGFCKTWGGTTAVTVDGDVSSTKTQGGIAVRRRTAHRGASSSAQGGVATITSVDVPFCNTQGGTTNTTVCGDIFSSDTQEHVAVKRSSKNKDASCMNTQGSATGKRKSKNKHVSSANTRDCTTALVTTDPDGTARVKLETIV